MMNAALVTPIYKHLFRLHPAQSLHLTDCLFERCSIVWTAVSGFDPHYPTLFRGRHHAHLASEFVFLVCLALGDTFHLGCVHTVKLVTIVPLLTINTPRYLKHPF